MEKKSIMLIPIDPTKTKNSLGKECKSIQIWDQKAENVDTFKVPNNNIPLNTPVAFRVSGFGVMAFGKVSSAAFINDDVDDINYGELVAEITFAKILENPAEVNSEEIYVAPFPMMISSPSLIQAYIDHVGMIP